MTLSQLFIKHDPDKYSWIQTKGGFLPTSTTFHSNLGKSTSSSILQLGEKKKNNQNNQNQPTPQDTDLDKSINTDSTFSTTSTHSTTSSHDDNIDDDNDQQQIGEPIKYRDVRDIFTCFQDTKKDITTDLSYTNGLDWYDHSNTTTNTTNIPNTTTNLLVRPPKSPLRASLRCKSKKQSKQSSKTMNTSLSPSSSCSSLVSLLSNYSSSSPESPNTPLDHHHEFMDPIHTDSNISTCSNHSRQSSHKKKQQQKSNQHHQDEDKVRLYLQGKDGATAQYVNKKRNSFIYYFVKQVNRFRYVLIFYFIIITIISN